MKYYIIYKITNLVNGKTYIGKHIAARVDDDYMGSGKHLRYAINKYGVENFAKTILQVYSTEDEMNARERELVTEEWCLRDDTYNLCVGGQGGFSYINRTRVKDEAYYQQRKIAAAKMPSEIRIANGAATGKNNANRWKEDPGSRPHTFTAEFNKEMSNRAQSDVARLKRTDTRRKNKFQVGENNSQFGTTWITNGTENKKIKKVDSVPDGWYTGRTQRSRSSVVEQRPDKA